MVERIHKVSPEWVLEGKARTLFEDAMDAFRKSDAALLDSLSLDRDERDDFEYMLAATMNSLYSAAASRERKRWRIETS